MATTYEPEGDGATDSDCTPAAGWNEVAPLTRTDSTDVTREIPTNTTEISGAWTTPTSEPNSADWASADYTGGVEVGVIDADASFTIALIRVNSGCTLQETLGTSGSFSATGPASFTVNTDPSSGAAGDRYQMRITGTNANHHATQTLTITVNDVDTTMVWETLVVGFSILPQINNSSAMI